MTRAIAIIALLSACDAQILADDAEDGLGEEEAGAVPPPNFILILTDDQRWDAWGHGQKDANSSDRLPWMIGRTPNLDRLADEGVHFSNAFAVSSLCAPSRAAFLTGQYNHRNGIVDNNTSFPASAVTFATTLRNAGWQTGYFGKWHMGMQTSRPGFDEHASFVGQGQYVDCPMRVNGVTTPTTGWVDDVTTAYAVDFIERHQDQRFAMVVGFKSPHAPHTPPGRLMGLFPNIQNIPSPSRNALAPFVDGQGTEPTAANLRHYSRTIVGVDQNVGKILDKLDQLDLAADTVVVFASDNGYMLGDHGRSQKSVAYEESIRIPLILRYPRLGAAGTHVRSTVLNIDVAPTMLALAGLSVPGAMQGGSWRPLINGNREQLRDQFLYEYFASDDDAKVPTIVALRREDTKLITYPGNPSWVELFDLVDDRHEIRNLASSQIQRLQLMKSRLADEKIAVGYHVP